MIGMQPEREEDSGNSISAGGMQSEAQAGEGGREMDGGGREGGILGGMWPASDHVCWPD